ncbi:tetratricopeptide repeat protein [Gynuella sunshinyii]|uniref:Putative Zn-dependent protease, contains TPR repeats n=1 Tax=Gynuella sunshinyii YC6258 TaxID=1445510 RepID=A0A0C5UZL0_9GAMM|nr:tetratricopeptide repeat protein [Gynuella sunshinyii]AJQ92730.1 putative Zn-dependent protease, contains TPR repeats [Gynuella sunshinyii YC6258]
MKSVEQYIREISPLCQQHNFHSAVTLLKQAVSDYPKHEILLGLLASCYQELGISERAQDLYQNIVALNPENYLAIHQLGLIDFQQQKWQAALSVWEKLLLRPDDFLTKYYAALCYEQLENPAQARLMVKAAQQAAPTDHAIYPEILELKERLGEH